MGGFPFDLSEGDLLTIFSQYGNPTHLNLIRDRETGKSKGFAFLKYEDQRSCDVAVDNLGGAEVLGRRLRVDHTRYKKGEGEGEETFRVERLEVEGGGDEVGLRNGHGNGHGKRGGSGEETEDDGGGERRRKKKRRERVMVKEEMELEELLRIKEGEEEDPMRQYLIEQKREEVQKALLRVEGKKKKEERHRHEHRHDEHGDDEKVRRHRSHRHRDEINEDPQPRRRPLRTKTTVIEARERIGMEKRGIPVAGEKTFLIVSGRGPGVGVGDAETETESGQARDLAKPGLRSMTMHQAEEISNLIAYHLVRAHDLSQGNGRDLAGRTSAINRVWSAA